MTVFDLPNENMFKTSDLPLIGVLALNYPIHSIERVPPRRAVFCFTDSESLRELVDKYWRKELQVEPIEYFQQIRIIKSRIYAN